MHSGIKFGVKIDNFHIACRCILHCRTTALVIYFAYLYMAYKKVLNPKSQLFINNMATPGACADQSRSLAEPRPFYFARWLREPRPATPSREDYSCETSLPLMKTLKDYPTREGSSPWSHPTSYTTGYDAGSPAARSRIYHGMHEWGLQ